ncbi:hypothetical protein EDD92_4132 [Streptomyces sp. TLI_185]|nr:hypothetical protein EDD92_4132 [Streptomyces sp. TLI_185]
MPRMVLRAHQPLPKRPRTVVRPGAHRRKHPHRRRHPPPHPVPIIRLEHRAGPTNSRWYHLLKIPRRHGDHDYRVPWASPPPRRPCTALGRHRPAPQERQRARLPPRRIPPADPPGQPDPPAPPPLPRRLRVRAQPVRPQPLEPARERLRRRASEDLRTRFRPLPERHQPRDPPRSPQPPSAGAPRRLASLHRLDGRPPPRSAAIALYAWPRRAGGQNGRPSRRSAPPHWPQHPHSSPQTPGTPRSQPCLHRRPAPTTIQATTPSLIR